MAPPSWLPGGFTPEPPFRWNVKKREQLGAARYSWGPGISSTYVRELVVCSARVIALCADGDLFFVGRSPDNLFDLLSGIFDGSSWEDRIRLLPVSLKWTDELNRLPETQSALRRYLASLDLAPDRINSRARPTVLADIVDEGSTYGELVTAWRDWAADLHIPWVQMRRKLRLIGITTRTKTSPKTRRWQQHIAWAPLLPASSIKNVAVPGWVWGELATGAKASRTFMPVDWADPNVTRRPARGGKKGSRRETGLKRAAYLYRCGQTEPVRERFVAELLRTQNVRLPAVRSLAHELRARPHDGPDSPFQSARPEMEELQLWLATRFRENVLDLPLSEPEPPSQSSARPTPKPPPTSPGQESPSRSSPPSTAATPD